MANAIFVGLVAVATAVPSADTLRGIAAAIRDLAAAIREGRR